MTFGGFQLLDTTPGRVPLYHSPQCGACGLWQKVESPKMPVSGEGRKGILIIGEAPGNYEDQQGIPFVGATGRLLERTLADFGIDMRKDCWIANAVRCHPYKWNSDHTKKENRPPTEKEIAYCRPWLTGNGNIYGDIKKLNPSTILLLGGAATDSILGWLWKEDSGRVGRWIGWRIPCQQTNAWICPAWHPSYVSREEDNPIVKTIWRRHLEAALALKGRPWEKVPDFKSMVDVIRIPRQAAHMIHEIIRMGKPTAIDIETTTLKPDGENAEIYSCSLSNGMITISFPWQGESRTATLDFIASDIPKIGFNVKFETRYFLAKEGVRIKDWIWDGMLMAHALDNRPDSKALKFQSFVLLGQPSYDDFVKPYFQSEGPNSPNRIKQVDLQALLLYGGLDALLEYRVANIQAKQLEVELN